MSSMQKFFESSICNDRNIAIGGSIGFVAGLVIGSKIVYNHKLKSVSEFSKCGFCDGSSGEIPEAFCVASMSSLVGAAFGVVFGMFPIFLIPIGICSVSAVCAANANARKIEQLAQKEKTHELKN